MLKHDSEHGAGSEQCRGAGKPLPSLGGKLFQPELLSGPMQFHLKQVLLYIIM